MFSFDQGRAGVATGRSEGDINRLRDEFARLANRPRLVDYAVLARTDTVQLVTTDIPDPSFRAETQMLVTTGQLRFGEDGKESCIRKQAIKFVRPVHEVIVALSGFQVYAPQGAPIEGLAVQLSVEQPAQLPTVDALIVGFLSYVDSKGATPPFGVAQANGRKNLQGTIGFTAIGIE